MVVSFNSSSSTSVSKHDNSYSSTGSKPAPRLRLLSRHRTIGLSATIGHGWAEETLRAKLMQRRKRQLGINRKLSTPDNLGATGQGEDGGCNRKLTLKEVFVIMSVCLFVCVCLCLCGQLNNTPKPRRPGVRFTTSALVLYTWCAKEFCK